jgi:hypothetical protein
MKGIFEFLINGKIETFYDYKEIPENFDHVIKFIPEVPQGPHTHEQHEEMDQWNNRLQELIAKEKSKYGY